MRPGPYTSRPPLSALLLFLAVVVGVPVALAWAVETYAPWLPGAINAAIAPAEPVLQFVPTVLLLVIAWLMIQMMQYFGGVGR